MDAIQVKNLNKKFKTPITHGKGVLAKCRDYFMPRYDLIDAVRDLSFSISPGECVAFIGPNGAGKSTTIKMLTGIMRPTGGSAHIFGMDPNKERRTLSPLISVVFGHCSKLWYHLPVVESFSLLASIYDIPANEYRKRRDDLVELFSISHLLNKPVRQLSLGERMRCELVASFLHKPRIVFLDEPTIGLDITAKALIRDLLRSMCKESGCTLLLTSHDTDDIEQVCDRVILINQGKCVVDDSVDNMKRNYLKKKIVTFSLDDQEASIHIAGVRPLKSSPHQLICEIDLTTTTVREVIATLMQRYSLRDITIEDLPLETVIETFYKQSL